jgi:hypothetical protein
VTRDRSTLIAYLPPERRDVRVDLERFGNRSLRGHWFDPRTGAATPTDAVPRSGSHVFRAPGEGDWVLVLDDEAKRYGPPGGRVR